MTCPAIGGMMIPTASQVFKNIFNPLPPYKTVIASALKPDYNKNQM
jgi:hypothetical protein